MALGVDAVEFDVQFTRDGVPIVLHDETLKRMAGAAASPRSYDFQALKGFDLGLRYGDLFRGERLPSVAEVAAAVPARIGLHVELKDYVPIEDRQILRLVEVLERNGGLERAVFSSAHEDQLTSIRRVAPQARIGLLLFRDVRFPQDAARRAAHIGCVSIHPNAEIVDPELVEVTHRHGMKLYAFTVNERSVMKKLLQMGVDGCFTDYPDRMREEAA